MLTGSDLERTLQRYRVADPPTTLASTIVAATLDIPGRFEWLWGPAAAAAVLTIWVAFRLATTEPSIDPSRAHEVAFVTEALGGGANAAAFAEIVVPRSPRQDLEMALAASREDRWQGN